MSDGKPIRVRRGRQNAHYTAISNQLIDHPTLSAEARIALIYLLSKPADWELQIFDLRRLLGTGDKARGRNKTYEIIKELKSSYYVQAVEEKDNGRFVGITYYVYDEPFETPETPTSEPLPEIRDTVKKSRELPLPANRDTKRPPNPQFRDTANRHLNNKRKKQKTDLPPSPPKRSSNQAPPNWEAGFEKLWSKWPKDQKPDVRRAAESAFRSLSSQDQAAAVTHAANFRRLCKARKELALMIPYLKDRLFTELVDGPEIDSEGRYVFTPERPEWGAWVGYLSQTYGPNSVGSITKSGKFVDGKRWPPKIPESASGAST